MPLSKLLSCGDKVLAIIETVDIERAYTPVFERVIVQARVTWVGYLLIGAGLSTGQVGRSFRLRDEGVWWARGWEGPDANALRATLLLQRSAL